MSVPFAIAWQRLVQRRYTGPARQHAEKMRREAEHRVSSTAGAFEALQVGAGHLERLANMLDELVKPAGEPLRNVEELEAWLQKDMREHPDEWRKALGR